MWVSFPALRVSPFSRLELRASLFMHSFPMFVHSFSRLLLTLSRIKRSFSRFMCFIFPYCAICPSVYAFPFPGFPDLCISYSRLFCFPVYALDNLVGQRCDVLPVNALHFQTYTPIISSGLWVTCLHVHVCFARFCLCVIRLCLSFPRPRVEILASESVVPFGEEEFIPIRGKGLNNSNDSLLCPMYFYFFV